MASRMWKLGTRRAMAYVEGEETARRVWEAAGRRGEADGAPKRLGGLEAKLQGAMAVYIDGKGKPFAWQIPFDVRRWDDVLAALP